MLSAPSTSASLRCGFCHSFYFVVLSIAGVAQVALEGDLILEGFLKLDQQIPKQGKSLSARTLELPPLKMEGTLASSPGVDFQGLQPDRDNIAL